MSQFSEIPCRLEIRSVFSFKKCGSRTGNEKL